MVGSLKPMSTMSDMMKVLSMPCRGHADIISRSFDAPLSTVTRWGLWMHERYCTGCRGYHRQLLTIRLGASRLFGFAEPLSQGVPPAHAPARPAHTHGPGRPCPHEVRQRLAAAVARRTVR